jgi:hypothetical protein
MPRRSNRTKPGVLTQDRTHTTMRPEGGARFFVKACFGKPYTRTTTILPPLQGGFFYFSVPGVKTPGSVLLPLRGMKLILVAIFSLFNWLT